MEKEKTKNFHTTIQLNPKYLIKSSKPFLGSSASSKNINKKDSSFNVDAIMKTDVN